MEKKPSVKLNRLLEEEEKKTEIEDVFFWEAVWWVYHTFDRRDYFFFSLC